MTDSENNKPWWIVGLNFSYLCLWLLFLAKFLRKDNIGFLFPLSIIGIWVLVVFIHFIRDCYKQKAQYTIKSVLILTFCIAVFCSIYSCFGLGAVLFVYSGVYIWILFTWYWAAHVE